MSNTSMMPTDPPEPDYAAEAIMDSFVAIIEIATHAKCANHAKIHRSIKDIQAHLQDILDTLPQDP